MWCGERVQKICHEIRAFRLRKTLRKHYKKLNEKMQTPAPSPPASPAALAPCVRDRSLVLVGMMGAGKSWLGRRLAARLARPFYDADDEIARAAQCSIADMFARHGEAHFRAREHAMLVDLLARPPSVIAAGGGAFAHKPTHEAIQAGAISIWLNTDAALMLRRLRTAHTQRAKRPLLPSAEQDLPQALARLSAERAPWYRKAHIMLAPPEDGDAAVDLALARLKDAPQPTLA